MLLSIHDQSKGISPQIHCTFYEAGTKATTKAGKMFLAALETAANQQSGGAVGPTHRLNDRSQNPTFYGESKDVVA